MKNETFLSVVLINPKFDDTALQKLKLLHIYLSESFEDFEILLIDRYRDSVDRLILNNLLQTRSSIRYLQLAFKVSDDVAMYAGFENAIGDHVMVYDLNIHSPDNIEVIFEKAKSGGDIFIGSAAVIPKKTFKEIIISFVQKLCFTKEMRPSDLICLSRNAVNALTKSGRLKEGLKNKLGKLGLDVYHVSCLSGRGVGSLTLEKLKAFGNRIVFSSINPFRVLFLLPVMIIPLVIILVLSGIKIELLAMLCFVFFLVVNSIYMFVSFEYMNRLMLDKNENFDYLIRHEITSETMVNLSRLNVEIEK